MKYVMITNTVISTYVFFFIIKAISIVVIDYQTLHKKILNENAFSHNTF